MHRGLIILPELFNLTELFQLINDYNCKFFEIVKDKYGIQYAAMRIYSVSKNYHNATNFCVYKILRLLLLLAFFVVFNFAIFKCAQSQI